MASQPALNQLNSVTQKTDPYTKEPNRDDP